MNEEYLDLVDEHDHVIGCEKRETIYQNGWHNYRVVNAFIVNSEGKLWIPRRTADKSTFPLHLDFAVGGHVESGSTYEKTIQKEAHKELNLILDQDAYREIGYYKAGQFGLSSFMKVYEIKLDTVLGYNLKEFIECVWLTPAELMGKIHGGDLAKGDLPILVELLYLKNEAGLTL